MVLSGNWMNRHMMSILLALIFFAGGCADDCKSTNTISAAETDDSSLSQCLPSGIKVQDIVEAIQVRSYPLVVDKVTVGRKLKELKASCCGGKLRDASGREILFYRLTGCWGNPPVNYRDILERQKKEIGKLRERYTVIEMTCNPSGLPLQ